MKRLLLILFLCPLVAFGQTVKEFWGIPFGISVSAVKEKMKQKGLTPGPNSSAEALAYHPDTFAGESVDKMVFYFVDGKFSNSITLFRGENSEAPFSIYKRLKQKITDKYRKPDTDIEYYKSPYEKNDGYAAQAVKLGKATFMSQWEFSKGAEADGVITLVIMQDLAVGLRYEDGVLSELDKARREKKEVSDL